MNLNDLANMPRSKKKYLTAAFFTQSEIDSIQKKTRELCNLVEETFGCLNNEENPELFVEKRSCFSPSINAEFISLELERSSQTVQSSIKVLEKIEAKRIIARLSKDLEEIENNSSPFGKFFIKTNTMLLESSKKS